MTTPPEVNTIAATSEKAAHDIFHDFGKTNAGDLGITEADLAGQIQVLLESLNNQWQGKYAQTMEKWSEQSLEQQAENDRLRALVKEVRAYQDIFKGRAAGMELAKDYLEEAAGLIEGLGDGTSDSTPFAQHCNQLHGRITALLEGRPLP